eukprot:9121-Chlamydomonas_euryale.AAC.4
MRIPSACLRRRGGRATVAVATARWAHASAAMTCAHPPAKPMGAPVRHWPPGTIQSTPRARCVTRHPCTATAGATGADGTRGERGSMLGRAVPGQRPCRLNLGGRLGLDVASSAAVPIRQTAEDTRGAQASARWAVRRETAGKSHARARGVGRDALC